MNKAQNIQWWYMKNNTLVRDKNILLIEFLNKKHKLFKHEQQDTHLVLQNVVHWNNSLCVDMSFHSETLFWLDQFLFLLLNAAFLPIL